MFAKTFIHRPVLATVISLVILIAGLLAIPTLPTAQYPNMVPPTVQVTCVYPGADSATVEQTVAAPIEQQVNGAEQMIYMSSKSRNDGSYQLTVTFEVGRDPDLASVDVQNRVNRAMSTLPPSVVQNGITVQKQSTQILMVVNLFSPDESRDNLFLSNYTTINVLDPLNRIQGISSASVPVGLLSYAMRMWINPDTLASKKLVGADLAAAIQEQNVQAAAGIIGQPPQPPGLDFQYPVSVKGLLDLPEEFADIVVRAEPGNMLQMKDVARIELGSQSYNTFGRLNGKPAIPILIYQLPGANALDLAKQIRLEMAKLSQSFPPGVTYEVTFDSTIFVKASIEEVLKTLRDAFILVVIVIFTFLGGFRATLIPMLAVPVSLVGTFAVLAAIGFSINTLTLFGIVLAIGIVVDDAIVVVEAVEHHIEHGLSAMEATEKAMEEVSGPVIAIALVLCSVFVPVAFMGGLTGQLYQQFAITLSVSVVLSALVALTLTPALCTLILKPRKPMRGPLGWYLKGFNWIFDKVGTLYGHAVGFLLRHLVIGIAFLGVVLFATYSLNEKIPGGFVPSEDNGYVFVGCTLPSGASVDRTNEVCKQAEKIMMGIEGVKSVITLGGTNVVTSANGPNQASFIAVFTDWKVRQTPKTRYQGIMKQMAGAFSQIPEGEVFPVNPPPIPGLGSSGGFVLELEDQGGHTPEELKATAEEFLAKGRQNPSLAKRFVTTFSTDLPSIKVNLDRLKAKSLGIKLTDIFSALNINLGGLYVNQFNRFGRTWRVYLQSEAEYRRNPEDIGNIYVRSQAGDMIPLDTLAEVEMVKGPDTLLRYNLYRTSEIYGGAAPGRSSGEAIKAVEELAAKELPSGYGIEWTGTAYQENLSAGQQSQILIMALIFVFLFLAAQYESWTVPFSVLLGLPAGIMGALGGTMLAGHDNNVYVQIGIVALIGLAAKNAILIVEFAKEEYEKTDKTLVEATLAGAKLRFRPILMTAFAFILGVVPLMIAHEAGAASQRSLGTAVGIGMLVATLIGVFLIPTLYVTIQGLTEKVTGKKKKPIAATAEIVAEPIVPTVVTKPGTAEAVIVEKPAVVEKPAKKSKDSKKPKPVVEEPSATPPETPIPPETSPQEKSAPTEGTAPGDDEPTPPKD